MYNTHTVYANTVMFSYTSGRITVILERFDENHNSLWRLPTSPVISTSTSLSALETHLYTHTGVKASEVAYQEQLYTTEFLLDSVNAVCISYIHIAHETSWHKGKAHIGLFPLDTLPKLSDQDQAVLSYGIDRLRAKAIYTNILALLLPVPFSLAVFQDAYETITGTKVDRRNFRKKITGLNFLNKADLSRKAQANEAQLYVPKQSSLQILERPL
jgi:8-oxo-dGTP diphosphatase